MSLRLKNDQNKKSFSDKQIISRFILVNYLDFIQYQKFPNTKAEQSLKLLYYAFIFTLDLFNKNDEFIKSRFKEEYNQILEQIPGELRADYERKNISKLVKLLKRRLFKNKIDYRWLLISELIYTYKVLDVDFNKDNADFVLIWNYFGIRKEKQIDNILSSISNPSTIKNKHIRNSFNEIESFFAAQYKYFNQKVFNIGVCATMSAGKSTFVNALLGGDYLPSRNEATTACVTSVYDNDSQKKMIGFSASNNDILELSDNLLYENIDKWNSDRNVNHIYVQADLDDISSDNVICAVHDTPGTNNSGNLNHHDITFEFLLEHEMDVLLFVTNIEHLCTNDEKNLLCEIKSKIIKDTDVKVIFVINKADSIDEQKDGDITEIITKYKDYIEELGFVNPIIQPLSSKAARLLKMALKHKAQDMSIKEQREFALLYDAFLEDFDFSSDSLDLNDSNEKIKIGKIEYSESNIRKALNRTGIIAIEKEIEKLF